MRWTNWDCLLTAKWIVCHMTGYPLLFLVSLTYVCLKHLITNINIIMWCADNYRRQHDHRFRISSVFLSHLRNAERPFRYLSIGLPFVLFPSRLPIVTIFSSFFLLITGSKNVDCLHIISLINLQRAFATLRTVSLVYWSAHCIICILIINRHLYCH